MTCYYIQKLLETPLTHKNIRIKKQFSTFVGYKNEYMKMLPFYTLKTIREINKLIYNCIKRIKYLGINLTKAMKATLNMGENNSK